MSTLLEIEKIKINQKRTNNLSCLLKAGKDPLLQ